MEVVADRVVGLGSEDEVGGDQLGALVDELEEGVLSIGAGLAEENGAWDVSWVSCTRLSTYQWCTWQKIHQR